MERLLLLILVVFVCSATRPADVMAKSSSAEIASLRGIMIKRSLLCSAALLVQSVNENQKRAKTYLNASGVYELASSAMSGVLPISGTTKLVRSVLKEKSKDQIKTIARRCADNQLLGTLDFSLAKIPGFPSIDYLRAESCKAVLDFTNELLKKSKSKGDKKEAISGISAIYARLHLYVAAYEANMKALGVSMNVGGHSDSYGDRFLKKKYGKRYASNGDVYDCYDAGRNILISLPDPEKGAH